MDDGREDLEPARLSGTYRIFRGGQVGNDFAEPGNLLRGRWKAEYQDEETGFRIAYDV